MNSARLYFLDAVRAFAILMMLQGHFIDTLLNPVWRDDSYLAYNIWSYFRGVTAPTFFTISGLVVLYLLLKAKEKGNDKKRIKKGLTRGIMLIGIGYLLRVSFGSWLTGYFDTYFLVIDVLQCIGLSLIMLIGLYILTQKNSLVLAIVLFISGFMCFVTEPLYRTITLENVPLIFANYMTKANGSIFTILPWFGYVSYGGCIAILFHKYANRQNFKILTVLGFFVLGFLLIHTSTYHLHLLSELTNIQLFQRSSDYNYLFTRLGDVMILFGIFYSFENYLKQSIITSIGEKTLNIYVVHFIIIYGSFTGVGLKRFLNQALDPWEAVIGAILFIIVVCIIVLNLGKTNAFIYKHLRRFLHLVKRTKDGKDETDEDDGEES
uniref:heparan-alpha-glucosaminide N-acetyltransferase domain-containing protein n=1 Tax=Gelidibacter sp. TaxID=2018083 RepID=UPI004049FABD